MLFSPNLVLLQITDMKIQKSKSISAFGGMNFVFNFLDSHSIGNHLENHLPTFANQSKYTWKDILYSLLSVYLCGGDCIEDLQTHLKNHFRQNPFIKIPSPDTVLRRLASLSKPCLKCKTKRGTVEHDYSINYKLEQLNISILKQLGVFDQNELTLDYDNTIIFNEKSDSRMTYKRNLGYQPGVCTINEQQILYIENRNGNSDAKSFQKETLTRIFEMLARNSIRKADHFRADAASYQYDVVKVLEQNVKNFYIGCRNSYIEKYFTTVKEWETIIDTDKNEIDVGEVFIKPFLKQAKDCKDEAKTYRLIVKRYKKEDGQVDIFTNDAYHYRAIITNNTDFSAVDIARFYNHRGNMERQFDILKNDFGWNYLSFSSLHKNTVFLYFTAICRNLYHTIINFFSGRTSNIKSYFRVKAFLFRFIILPSKWVKHSRQIFLRIYGEIPDGIQ